MKLAAELELYSTGTSEGAEKGWDKRGRGRKEPEKKLNPKQQRALSSYKPSTRAKQKIAYQMQKLVAAALGGQEIPDHQPFDVQVGRIYLEVKALIDQKNDKLTMHPESLERKLNYAKVNGIKKVYTVAIDKRGGKQDFYYRKGLGSFRLGKMERLTSHQELKRVIR